MPFYLGPETSPEIGLLCPPVITALHTSNAWYSANGRPPAWGAPSLTSDSSTLPPYIGFVPTLAQGTPAAHKIIFADSMLRSLVVGAADSNVRVCVGCTFAGIIDGRPVARKMVRSAHHVELVHDTTGRSPNLVGQHQVCAASRSPSLHVAWVVHGGPSQVGPRFGPS